MRNYIHDIEQKAISDNKTFQFMIFPLTLKYPFHSIYVAYMYLHQTILHDMMLKEM